MSVEFDAREAQVILAKLSNAPVAPGGYAHFINVGTDPLLEILEQRYFRDQIRQGLGSFKYLQAGYGGGKTQFILSLAERAQRNGVVTCRVDVGAECPFNSKLAIFHSVMSSFLPLDDGLIIDNTDRGIVVLMEHWIAKKLKEHGVDPGDAVPDAARAEIERTFKPMMNGAADIQMATGLRAVGQRLLEHACGADPTSTDAELWSWVRGDRISSPNLKRLGLSEAAKDENAFNRLSTTLKFLRSRLGYSGFFIAFDEGSRAMSFRRGSIKQKQMVENLLDFINKTAELHFGGVMFLYAANDEFRSEVIAKYEALENRIGSVAMSAGSPMVPFIDLDAANTPDVLAQLGERLMDLFEAAQGLVLNRDIQSKNFTRLAEATFTLRLTPRIYVSLVTRFLPTQVDGQRVITTLEAEAFVAGNDPDADDDFTEVA